MIFRDFRKGMNFCLFKFACVTVAGHSVESMFYWLPRTLNERSGVYLVLYGLKKEQKCLFDGNLLVISLLGMCPKFWRGC